jgi:molybdopterin converting factor small subunit
MATVHIPAAMRKLTGGETKVVVPGDTLEAVIANLETTYPGLKSRLVEGERIRPGLATFVDGVNASSALSTRLGANAEIYFAPAMAGG